MHKCIVIGYCELLCSSGAITLYSGKNDQADEPLPSTRSPPPPTAAIPPLQTAPYSLLDRLPAPCPARG